MNEDGHPGDLSPGGGRGDRAGHELPGREEEGLTAWGEEVGGLQAGLGLRPGAKRAYRPGETVTLVVRVRNVSKEAVVVHLHSLGGRRRGRKGILARQQTYPAAGHTGLAAVSLGGPVR